MAIVGVRDLVKSYGKIEAVRGISFDVEEGEVFGLLGPNGAGKTTTVEILEGLRKADAGTAVVDGIDVSREPARAKERVGRSEERRVGKECRSRWWPDDLKEKYSWGIVGVE